MSSTLQDDNIIVLSIGLLSALVDNVPLVAAVQGMYDLSHYPTDHYFWEFLAYCTGTGGSVLIIGSAAGVCCNGDGENWIFLVYQENWTTRTPRIFCRCIGLYLGTSTLRNLIPLDTLKDLGSFDILLSSAMQVREKEA